MKQFKEMNKLIMLAAIFSILYSACTSDSEPVNEEGHNEAIAEKRLSEHVIEITDQQFKAAGIAVNTFGEGSVKKTIKVNGTIESPPEDRHTISFPMGGFLKNTSLVRGQRVKKGSVLATMEDASFIQLQEDYLLSKSKLDFLETDYQRQLELSKTQSSSQRVFQQAKTDLANQQIINTALGEKLKLIGIDPDKLTAKNISRTVHVYSPLTGYVSEVNVNPGKYAAPTDVLFEIIDLSELHVSLTVFEGNAASLKVGQKLAFTTNESDGKKGSGTIEYISPNLDERRAVEVHCHIDQPSPRLMPGAFVTAEINVDSQPGKTVPDEAVVSWQNQHYVFLEEQPLKFVLQPVTVGGSAAGFTAITSELPTGKNVVTANAYTLLTMLKNTGDE
jgi:cobalt-zinc-cadmium efflux system membrane fusion protein